MIATETIREAVYSDIDRVVEMGRRFLLEGPYREQLADKPRIAAELMEKLLKSSSSKILVSEEDGKLTGVFAFVIFPHYFSGEITAGELIWYVEPEHRGKTSLELLWKAEKMAYEMGAKWMQLTAPTEEVGKLYGSLRPPYVQIEISYQTKLEDRVKH